uniref:Cellulose synthase (UDP-forming) n=2 Tax=Opuntia streptacantha TaxID=393608 RepID=A0A7C9F3F3_OPUST
MHGFNVTSKLQDDELKKRYDQGVFEFGVASPMLVPLTMAAILNLLSFTVGLMRILTRGTLQMEGLILQILASGVVVINCWPVYEALVLRSDKGRMPTKITLLAASLVFLLCLLGCAFV